MRTCELEAWFIRSRIYCHETTCGDVQEGPSGVLVLGQAKFLLTEIAKRLP
ncbi:hypothetical protein ACLOAV_006836 [Pseudogymnoascus australis]